MLSWLPRTPALGVWIPPVLPLISAMGAGGKSSVRAGGKTIRMTNIVKDRGIKKLKNQAIR